MREETLVVVNPIAGGGRARRAQRAVSEYLAAQGHRAVFIESRSSEDLRKKAAAAAASGYGNLVALGGDGAIHHLIEGAFGSGVVFGIIPAGNGNDIAAALGIPLDPVAAADSFLKSQPQAVDVIRTYFPDAQPRRTTFFLGAGGMGLDAEAARLANTRFARWPGVTRYIAGALRAFAEFEPLEVEIESDVVRSRERALFVAVANGARYGSGVRIAPQARMNDAKLDITVVSEIPWVRLIEAFPIILQSGDLHWPEIQRFQARRVALRPDRPALVHGDGEVLGEAPVEMEVLPGAIRVAAPALR